MKRIYIILFVLISYCSYSQDRVNNPITIKYKSVSETVDSIKGWFYDKDSGMWIEGDNAIYENEENKKANRTLSVYGKLLLMINYVIEYNNKEYYMLHFKENEQLGNDVYIFKKNEFDKILKLKNGDTLTVKYEFEVNAYSDETSEQILNKTRKMFNSDTHEKLKELMERGVFFVKLHKNFIRFNFPVQMTLKKFYKQRMKEHYFEIEFSHFKKLFNFTDYQPELDE